MKEESRRIKPGEVKWLGMDYPLQIRAKGLSGRIGKKIVISQSELEKKVLSFLAKNSFVYLGQPFSEKVDFKHIGYYKIWLIDTAVALVDVYSVLFPGIDKKTPELPKLREVFCTIGRIYYHKMARPYDHQLHRNVWARSLNRDDKAAVSQAVRYHVITELQKRRKEIEPGLAAKIAKNIGHDTDFYNYEIDPNPAPKGRPPAYQPEMEPEEMK
ncbi:hypothetical protein J4217_02440 [Candidatus Pacearchaeota archaeon]|nr:hypothetical protein [Candidatus Pacearchaeota archaeon]